MKKLIKLKNNFHGTETRVLVPTDIKSQEEAWELIQAMAHYETFYGPAHRRLARVEKALCGQQCSCGVVR